MPSINMKAYVHTIPKKEKGCLGVCQKSSMISKRSHSDVAVSQRASEFTVCCQNREDDYVPSNVETHMQKVENDKAIDEQHSSDEGLDQLTKLPVPDTNPSNLERMESTDNCLSNMETVFSPAFEHVEVKAVPNTDASIAGSNCELNEQKGADDVIVDIRSLSNYQTYPASDFFFHDTMFANFPLGELVNDDMDLIDSFFNFDYEYAEPNILSDVNDECVMLPYLMDTAKMTHSDDMTSSEAPVIDSDKNSLYPAFCQILSYNQEFDIKSDLDQAVEFGPQFIKNVPEISDVVSNLRPIVFPKESKRTKSTTLVLDLDETLVHATTEFCGDADFIFTVFYSMKDHVYYVKQRPHLHTFLERVAEMFEVVIFTASQSIYAEQLLDRLDPDGKFFSRRVYRESCIFSNGTYTKDLTILGVDLAKVAIVDNTPEVYRLQLNNGIPIKSWFNDRSDCALISLLPFLETLADADDVRPIIAKRFGNKE